MTRDLVRRLAAEAAGTMTLVATVVGSGIMADGLTNDSAVALLANTLPTAAILMVLITVLGPVSGAHLNPAVTLVFSVLRKMPSREAFAYAAAQVAGGIFGTVLAHAMFGLDLIQTGATARTGAAQWLAEGVATFGLVAVILLGLRSRPDAMPWLVGLYIAAAYWFTASTSFANPAVTLARGLSDTFAGIRLLDVPGFVLAQLAGALLASAAVGWLMRGDAPPDALAPDATPGSATR